MAKLIDVARAANISIGAASSVLGGKSSTIGTSPATRKRILEAAKRLGYTPSPTALSLSTGRTFTIGLMIHNVLRYLSHPSGARVIAGICQAAAAQNYRILLMTADTQNTFDARVMDACVVLGWADSSESKLIRKLAKDIPVVCMYKPQPGMIPVEIRQPSTPPAQKAAEYLYDLGHRHLAVVDTNSSQNRIASIFRKVAAQRGIDVRIDTFGDIWQTRIYPSVEQLASLDPMPTAIFAFDDDYAQVLMSRLFARGWSIPRDISIFSGSTHRHGFQLTPAVTGIDCQQDNQTTQIVTSLIAALQEKKTLRKIVIDAIPAELIERDSCAPPRTSH